MSEKRVSEIERGYNEYANSTANSGGFGTPQGIMWAIIRAALIIGKAIVAHALISREATK